VAYVLFLTGCEPLPPRLHVYAPPASKELSPEDIQAVIGIVDMIAAKYHFYPVIHPLFGALRQYSESATGEPVVMGLFLETNRSYVTIGAGGTYEGAIRTQLTKSLRDRFGRSRVRWVSGLMFNPV